MADEDEQGQADQPTADQPDMGAAESAATTGSGDGETVDEDRALDQSAIDAMLGDTFSNSALREESGMERIIKAGFVAYERMPMLENVFDRLVRFLSSTLRGFTNDNVDITMEDMRSLRFGDYMSGVPTSSLFSVFRAEQWRNYGLVILDSDLSYAIVDILMGAIPGRGAKAVENRPHTALERALIEKLVVITLADLSEAFTPVGKVDLSFERLEVSSSLAVIARPSNAAIAAKFHIDMGDRSGNMEIVIPYATFEPVREKLAQQFMGENFGSDSIWENHLISEIMETSVTVSTVFESSSFPLSQILALKKGSVLHLPCKADAPHSVRMECDGTPLFEGTLGRLHNMQAVRIDQRLIPPEEDLTPELLASLGAIPAEHHMAGQEGLHHVSGK
ncbi:flagellar motor switch protein FliM [Bombella sp. ESL0385]|uniref:flagellar motor switch protein FliM n=1 Tax=Bombella sp. ESL0385 TaxID=2676446 RepID=UPI0012D910D2|nr:flagellar motor switch protein FliM [Bombella sp. ESL0385]MCT6855386.1 flagellar motor switch protein FliM [Bombella apis]MUG90735.1 flagellar motor switch protein FliM [Bombella sp. ESL0385]